VPLGSLAVGRQSTVPIDPFHHQALVAEALVRDGAAFDAGEAFGEGDLFGRRQAIKCCGGCHPGLRVDPSVSRSGGLAAPTKAEAFGCAGRGRAHRRSTWAWRAGRMWSLPSGWSPLLACLPGQNIGRTNGSRLSLMKGHSKVVQTRIRMLPHLYRGSRASTARLPCQPRAGLGADRSFGVSRAAAQ